MATIKGLKCAPKARNTGKAKCAFDLDLIAGTILVPKGFYFTPAQLANLPASITALLTNNDPAQRGYYIGPYESFDDKSEAAQSQKLGYGRNRMIDRGVYNHEYTFVDGGLAYFLAVLAFRDKQSEYDAIHFDGKSVLVGSNKIDSTTGLVLGLAGWSLAQIYPYDQKFPNKNIMPEYRVAWAYSDSSQLNENISVYYTGGVMNTDIKSFLEPLGIQDVLMQDITPGGAAAGVFTVALTIADGDVSVADILPTLASAANFSCTRGDTGAVITITSCALNTAKTGFVFTLDTTDADYSATHQALINLVSVSTLATAGFKYYESAGIVETLT